MWLANNTRPDISFATGVLARHMVAPSKVYLDAAIRVLKYVNRTKEYKLRYKKHGGFQTNNITVYCNANWASDKTTGQKSMSGSIVMIGGNPVSWKAQLQKCVALSAVEAEYVAASEAAREAAFLYGLLGSLGLEPNVPTLLTDSLGCVQVSKDPAQHWRLKHIDTKYNYVQGEVLAKNLSIRHVVTEENLADMFTKPVGKHILHQSVTGLDLVTYTPTLARGGVEIGELAPKLRCGELAGDQPAQQPAEQPGTMMVSSKMRESATPVRADTSLDTGGRLDTASSIVRHGNSLLGLLARTWSRAYRDRSRAGL